MARILIVTVGIRSKLNAHLAMSIRARGLGYECAIASPMSSPGEHVAAAGFRFMQLQPAAGKWRFAPYPGGVAGWFGGGKHVSERRSAVLSGLGLPEVIEDFDPDLVIVDSEMHEHILVAHFAGVPTVLSETHTSVIRRPNNPVLSEFFIPKDGLLSRLRCWWGWEMVILRRAFSRLLRRLGNRGRDKHSVLKELVAAQGQQLRQIADTRQWPLYDFPGFPILRLTVPQMDFPPPLADERHRFLGPMILPASARHEDQALIDRVQSFVDERPAGEPLLLMSLGTLVTMPERILAAIDAVRDKPVTLLLATGPAGDLPSDKLPPNILATSWLPIAHLLEQVSVVICHAGTATINECVVAGVPMLVYPVDSLAKDQNGCAARIASRGLAIAGSHSDSGADMWRHIERLLQDPSFREQCRAMKAAFDKHSSDEHLDATLRELARD